MTKKCKARSRKSTQAISAAFLDQTVFVLDGKKFAKFIHILEHPPLPTGEMRRLLAPTSRPSQDDLALAIKNLNLILERTGGMLKARDAAALLGISRQVVDKRRRTNRLFAIKEGHRWFYPCAQFQDGKAVPRLPEILHLMQGTGPWVTLAFLVSPDSVLDNRTPLQALWREDMCDDVISLARGFRSGSGFA